MRNLFYLGAALTLLVSSTAFAYENQNDGYKFKDHGALATITSRNMHGFSTAENFVHAVQSYSAADVERITGEKFSTELFLQQYKNLALLQRSGLNLTTMPIKFCDLEKFIEQSDNLVLENKKTEAKPVWSIGKSGKLKTIAEFYPASQELPAYQVTYTSSNDRLYLLISVSNILLPSEELQEEKHFFKKADDKQKEKLAQDMKAFQEQHQKFIADFKTFTPEQGKAVYGCQAGNSFVPLPENWFYISAKVKEKEVQGDILLAAPTPMAHQMTQIMQNGTLSANKINNDLLRQFEENPDVAQLLKLERDEIYTQILGNFDSIFAYSSLKNDEQLDLSEFLAQPEQSAQELEFLCQNLLDHLKAISTNNDKFQLNDYQHNIKIDDNNICFDLDSTITLKNIYHFDTIMKFNFNKKQTAVAMYIHNNNKPEYKELRQHIDQWQF